MKKNTKYLPRIADTLLKDALDASGAVLVEGPKWCGKTWTAKHMANSEIFLQDPDNTQQYLEMANLKPSLLLQGKTPRLIDEWQMIPILWNAVRHAVDERGTTSQFILTGSTKPIDTFGMHTGTGRISRMKMRTMSLFESGESNGCVSLRELFSGNTDIEGFTNLTLEDLAFIIVRGGWPASVTETKTTAQKRAADYIEAIINTDISEADGKKRNPKLIKSLLQSLARNTASMTNISTILKDMAANDTMVSRQTISSYLAALGNIFVTEDQPAWNPALRSNTMLRTSVKRHFTDPSLAAAALNATPERLIDDIKTFGILFESLCIRDLRIYASAIHGEVFHYHDRNNLEADAIVQLNSGDWAAIEIKLGCSATNYASQNLLKLKEKINTERMKEPKFLAVITGIGNYAYRRTDGVLVIPIGCLGP